LDAFAITKKKVQILYEPFVVNVAATWDESYSSLTRVYLQFNAMLHELDKEMHCSGNIHSVVML